MAHGASYQGSLATISSPRVNLCLVFLAGIDLAIIIVVYSLVSIGHGFSVFSQCQLRSRHHWLFTRLHVCSPKWGYFNGFYCST